MPLANYTPPAVERALGDTTVTLHGLSLEHIAILINARLDDLDAITSLVQKSDVAATNDFSKLAMAIVTQAPGLAADIIALAAGEPDAAPVVQRMPGPTQLELLIAIGNMTFSEVGGIKKSVEGLMSLLAQMNPNLKAALMTTAASSGSITASAGT